MKSSQGYFVFVCLLIGLLLICYINPSAQEKAGIKVALKLQQRLEKIADNFNGTLGAAIKNIESSEEAKVNADVLFPMASVYKIPIMTEVFRQAEAGRFSLNERIELTEEMRTLGSGILTLMEIGLKPTIKDLATLMIIVSDNEATDMLLNKVGAANVNTTMSQLGLKNIRVDRTTREVIGDYLALMNPKLKGMGRKELMEMPEDFITPEMVTKADRDFSRVLKDVATPQDMTSLLVKIFKGEAASPSSCKQMLRILSRQQFNTRLPRYLPEDATVAHKTGTIGSTTNDAGIIFMKNCHIAITVFTKDKRCDRMESERAIAQVARLAYDYFDFRH